MKVGGGCRLELRIVRIGGVGEDLSARMLPGEGNTG